MSDVLEMAFMQRALVAGLLVGCLAGYYGVFVVQRRLSFLGAGLAHAAFGGVALGLLLEINPMVTTLPFTALVAVGITWVHDRTELTGDTSIGIFFALSVALGIVFLSLKEQYTADAFAYLFGSILAVRSLDLWITAAITGATLLSVPLWGRWAYATFDREQARTDRLPVERDDYIFSVLLAATVVASVKVVGILLTAAFLVIPPAASRLLASTFIQMTVLSIGLAVSTATVGLLVSYWMDVPSGPAIILVQASLFFAVLISRRR